MTVIQRHERSTQVLHLLKDYGPLSSRSLLSMIEPSIKKPRLTEVLWRMKKNGLVVLRNERLFGSSGVFYQLPQKTEGRKKIARILKCEAGSLVQSHFQRRELLHAQVCALWCFYLRKAFPNVEVIRDYEIKANPDASRALLAGGFEQDLIPDLLLIYRREGFASPLRVAIEVERSQKSDARLFLKLQRYTRGSLIDGVIYVCGTEAIERAIRRIYHNRVMSKTHRIRLYQQNFLLFALADLDIDSSALKMSNLKSENVSLGNWIQFLSTTLIAQRKDENFKIVSQISSPGSLTPKSNQ